MRRVGALVAVEVRAIAVARTILGPEALLRRPGLDPRAVHREVLVGHVLLRPLVDLGEEPLRHLRGQQTVAVLGEHRVVPHRIVHAEPDEPPEQQVVVDLLHQLPFASHRKEHLQQQRAQHLLRSHRRPSRPCIQRIELRAQRPQNIVRDLPHPTQRMLRRHPLLQRHIAEHPILYPLVSTHTP